MHLWRHASKLVLGEIQEVEVLPSNKSQMEGEEDTLIKKRIKGLIEKDNDFFK